MTDTPASPETPAVDAAPANAGLLGANTAAPAADAKDASLLGSSPDETAAAAKVAEAAAIKYEFKNTPEGYDAKALEAFARDNKVSPDVAQKLMERDVAQRDSFQATLQAKFEALQKTEWVQELKSDPKLGGNNWDASVMAARRANDSLSPELRAEISKLGLQNNPTLFRIAAEFGAKLKEDKFVRGNEATTKNKSYAETMYTAG